METCCCDGEKWVCEKHPGLPWPHKDPLEVVWEWCGGPGMPCVCNKDNPPWKNVGISLEQPNE